VCVSGIEEVTVPFRGDKETTVVQWPSTGKKLEVAFSSLPSVKGLMLCRSHLGQAKHCQSVDQEISLRWLKTVSSS